MDRSCWCVHRIPLWSAAAMRGRVHLQFLSALVIGSMRSSVGHKLFFYILIRNGCTHDTFQFRVFSNIILKVMDLFFD